MIDNLATRIRKIAIQLETETRGLSKPHTSELLDLANAVETIDGNLIYLTSCMAATADDLAERKTTPAYQISRQFSLLENCARALAGVAIWQNASTRAASLARVEQTRELVAERLRRINPK